ncbi:hypothetical protein [Streptomyces sp. NBC_01207]|uniref:hypothetical protein n=1 Tax=Streptomyces sp. NBC_01207 TaxID=2903772 RepID=UPI002E11C8FC|nr:hypothetical protein OG457_41320 [Streptomyces sp. NBC_01207]
MRVSEHTAPSSAAEQERLSSSATARPGVGPEPESASDTAPRRTGGPPTVVMPGRATPSAAAKPRHDVDVDGLSDLIVMQYDQATAVYLSSIQTWSCDYTICKTDAEASVKDLLPVGDVGGTTKPELLFRSFDGVPTLYEAGLSSTSAPLWSGGGWQKDNRLIATGDITGDRHPDLLARNRDGVQCDYKSIVGGRFAAPAYFGSGYELDKFIVGAGTTQLHGKGQNLMSEADNTPANGGLRPGQP